MQLCMEVLQVMQCTREGKALVAAVRGTVIEAKDAAARKAAAVDAEARKAAEEHESRRGEEKAVAWDSRDALVQVSDLLNRCIDATSWKDCRIGLYEIDAIIDEVKTGSYDRI